MGATVAQADSTGWMAMYCLNMLRIALELAQHDPAYESIASKFFEHFLAIAEAMNHVGCRAIEEGGIGMWDDETEWYCSLAEFPDGHAMRHAVVLDGQSDSAVRRRNAGAARTGSACPNSPAAWNGCVKHRKDLAHLVAEWTLPGVGQRRLAALMRGHRMKRVLARMLDETQFLSDYGVRSLSKYHQATSDRGERRRPRISASITSRANRKATLFGGNSNWRGPIWFPVNYLLDRIAAKIPSLLRRRFQNRMPHRLRQISSRCWKWPTNCRAD